MSTVIKNTRLTLEMIKIEHTLFALPFAFLGAVLAANGLPTRWQVLWIVVAMVGARSAAMAFNRIADRNFRREKSAHCFASTAGRFAVRWFCLGVYNHFGGSVSFGGRDAESSDTDSVARRARLRSALLFYEALDPILASRAWRMSFNRSYGRMDRRAR